MTWQSSPPRRERCGAESSHSWSHDTYSLEAEKKSRAQSPFWSFVFFCFLLFCFVYNQARTPIHRMAPPTFRIALPTSAKPLRKNPQILSCVHVPGDSNSVKLTIKVNNFKNIFQQKNRFSFFSNHQLYLKEHP